MTNALIAHFEIFRALHIISIIAWMAGLLMLPRLFAYQFKSDSGSGFEAEMILAQKRLVMIIMNPAMIAAWAFGSLMLWAGLVGDRYPWPFELWLWAKLVLVSALTGVHHILTAARKKFAQGARPKSEKYWRLLGEVPFVIAILVVLLAVLQPH